MATSLRIDDLKLHVADRSRHITKNLNSRVIKSCEIIFITVVIITQLLESFDELTKFILEFLV